MNTNLTKGTKGFTRQKSSGFSGGFTIIEVVLVLAIAGLIFLMVFIALPALQRGQRDTQRKNDLSRMMSQINSYQTNSKGNVPAASAAGMAALNPYLTAGGDLWQDPDGSAYTYVYGTGAAPTLHNIRYAVNARCNTANAGAIIAGTGNRQVAAAVGLEGGGAYCQQN